MASRMNRVLAKVRPVALQLSQLTPWPQGKTPFIWFFFITVLGFAFLMLPRSVGWRGDFLHSEDGQIFLTEFLANGWSSVADVYAGYLHVTPRLLTGTCATLIGPDGYAACVAGSANLVRVSLMFLAFPVFSAYARSWRWGLTAAAATLLFLPAGQQEVLANFTNLRWFLLFGAFLALIGVFRSAWLIALATVVALVASVSDPIPLLLAPLALWRAIGLKRWSKLPSLALMAGGIVHLVALEPGARGERGGFLDLITDPQETVGQILVRGPLTTQWGVTLSQDLALSLGFPLAIATLLFTGILVWLGWRARQTADPAVPFAVLLTLLGVGFLLVTLSFPASYIKLADFWSLSQPARYSALTGLFLTPVIVLVASRAWKSKFVPRLSRAWVVAAFIIFGIAVLGDSGGDGRSTDGPTWHESLTLGRQLCASGTDDPQVPNAAAFEGWQTTLTCEWIVVR